MTYRIRGLLERLLPTTQREPAFKCTCPDIDFVSSARSPWVEFRCPACGKTHWVPF